MAEHRGFHMPNDIDHPLFHSAPRQDNLKPSSGIGHRSIDEDLGVAIVKSYADIAIRFECKEIVPMKVIQGRMCQDSFLID
jgi:hypothetical protein